MPTDRIIGVHLDLKGTQFRPSYLPRLLDDLAGQGVNTVLVEYEDIFPFQGLDIALDREVVWSRATLSKFLRDAAARGIEVIPLQQCLGHLEYLFAWRRFRGFAMDKQYPSTLDIENPRGKALVFEMLRQVVEAHPGSRYVHVGMDEAHALVKRYGHGRVVEVFLTFLRELIALVKRSGGGKTPIVWSDMLENHFDPRADYLREFRDQVVIQSWDYASTGQPTASGRLAGNHVSRRWLNEPENPAAPAIGAGTTFVEDLPAEVRKWIKPFYREGRFDPIFQADLWTRLGFRVLGTSAARSSSHLSVLPRYNQLFANVRAWSEAIDRTGQLGQVASSWARGTSWGPPNFLIDAQWPIVTEMARSMGAKPGPFFAGVPRKTVDRIVRTLGRCRDDWRLEGKIAAEMEALSPSVKDHRYEWDGIALLARVLELQRKAEYVQLEVDFFNCNTRPVEAEWRRRLDDQKQTIAELEAMRGRVVKHFGKRYHGEAFGEWVSHLFDLHLRRLRESRKICAEKKRRAARVYARA